MSCQPQTVSRASSFFTQLTGSLPRHLLCVVLGLTLVLSVRLPATAAGDVEAVEPRHMVVTADNALLRCGAGTVWYPIGKLKAGTVLIVDGQTNAWRRVKLIGVGSAYVAADRVQETEDGKQVLLTASDKLKAANVSSGMRSSWKQLMDKPLPAGQLLQVLETIPGSDGKVLAYRVAAPLNAHGFIHEQFLRPATSAEKQAFIKKHTGGEMPKGLVREPAGITGNTKSVKTSEADKAKTPEASGSVDDSLIDSMVVETGTVESDQTDAVETEPESETAKPQPAELSVYAALAQSYQNVMHQPDNESEIDALILEFERAISTTTGEGQSTRRLVQRLSNRLELLKLKRDAQEEIRKLSKSQNQSRELSRERQSKIESFSKLNGFVLVGKLDHSRVYDGKRLTLMYRVRSLHKTSHTIGYVRSVSGIDFESLIGQVVGITGQVDAQSTRQVKIIKPSAVEKTTVPGV